MVCVSLGRPKRARKPNPRYINDVIESVNAVGDPTTGVKVTAFVNTKVSEKYVCVL